MNPNIDFFTQKGNTMQDFIAVLDFGSQYTHLISKRIRHIGAYTKIFSPSSSETEIDKAKGIVLSGGPASLNSSNLPDFNSKLLELKKPILGLCYGHQLIAQSFGGSVSSKGKGEFGKAILEQKSKSPLWENISFPTQVWMSHQDSVTKCPEEFEVTAQTDTGSLAALKHLQRPIFSFQFHPEVKDTSQGRIMLKNFINACGIRSRWSMKTFIENTIKRLRNEVGSRKVLMFLSGGVDSSVAFALLNKTLGQDRLLGLYINNGFMRKNESEEILTRYSQLGYKNIKFRNYSSFFLEALEGQFNPQIKRQIIGSTFIRMREKFLNELNLDPQDWMLGQGTLYPDIIESGGTENAEIIKYHHNRVQEVLDLESAGHVVEPLKDLYKDEVRQVGTLLGLPESIVWRHPFPGPGLAINILCSRGNESFPQIKKTIKEVQNCLQDCECEHLILPVRSVGVQGDKRTYTSPVLLLNAKRDWNWLESKATQIVNEVRTVNRVVFLLGSNTNFSDDKFNLHKAFCNKDRLDLLREADYRTTKILKKHESMQRIFQLLVILLPISKNGKEESLVLRPVVSEDVMTAQFARLDWHLLDHLVGSLLDITGIESVFYDITHKPPATFGWE